MKEKIEKILKKQQKKSFYATIQPTDSENKIKVTPRNKQGQCNCNNSYIVDLDSIIEIEELNRNIFCCNKELELIKIYFKEDAVINLNDVFSKAVMPITQERLKRKVSQSCMDACYNARNDCLNVGGNTQICDEQYDKCVENCY